METIGSLYPVRFAPAASGGMPHIGSTLSRDASQVDNDFSAALLAMAGHDLRQPLQVITSAHDVLAQTLATEEQQEQLIRAEIATAQLAGMLGQLVEALRLRERSGDDLHLPVPLRPVLENLVAELGEAARLKGITFLVTATRCVAFSQSGKWWPRFRSTARFRGERLWTLLLSSLPAL